MKGKLTVWGTDEFGTWKLRTSCEQSEVAEKLALLDDYEDHDFDLDEPEVDEQANNVAKVKTDIYDAYNLDRVVTVVAKPARDEPKKLHGSIWTFGGTGFILETHTGERHTLLYHEVTYFDSFDRVDVL